MQIKLNEKKNKNKVKQNKPQKMKQAKIIITHATKIKINMINYKNKREKI